MIEFLCESNTWNWNDFWQTVLGALLGFIFAIISSIIFGIVSRRAECVFIKNGVRVEFEAILDTFGKIDFNNQFIEPISVAYWDSLVQGSKFSFLYRLSWYPSVSVCYMKIKSLNEQIAVRNAQNLEASMALDDDKRNIASAAVEQIDNSICYNCKVSNANSIAASINEVLGIISRKKKVKK